MTPSARPHATRRDRALGRLRGLTVVTAAAGFAGTALFGAAAALTWSGKPAPAVAAPTDTEADDTGAPADDQIAPIAPPVGGPIGPSGGGRQGVVPGGTTPGFGRVAPNGGSGRAHVSTGGSG